MTTRNPLRHPPPTWDQTATYEWVQSQGQYNYGSRHKNRKTEKWVQDQQRHMGQPEIIARVMDSYDAEARRYKRLEYEMKKTVERMECERRYLEEVNRQWSLQQEDRRRQREMPPKSTANPMQAAFERYESEWQAIIQSSTPLTFKSIPWPMLTKPTSAAGITSSQVAAFLLSGAHSQHVTRKDRIRSAQLRWHPDRFRRLMERVIEEEKEAVEAGVGNVAKCLNDLAARETKVGRRSHTR